MTLDEAINRYERQTEELYNALPCDGCAFNTCKKEHRQLAEWLRELKKLRAEQKDVYMNGYNEGYEDGYCEALEDSH
jgi:flagellar biosynthesis/type III secretory pathway protein FliH